MSFELEKEKTLDPNTLFVALKMLENCTTVHEARSKLQTLLVNSIEKDLKKSAEHNEAIMIKYEKFFPRDQRQIARSFK